MPPSLSARLTRVLLKVESIYRRAFQDASLISLKESGRVFRNQPQLPCFLVCVVFPYVMSSLNLRRPEPMVFLTLPRTVREFVFVRCHEQEGFSYDEDLGRL